MLPREKVRHSHSITASELTRGVVPKLVRQHILLILILRISDPGIEPASPALQADSLPAEPLGKPQLFLSKGNKLL